MRFLFGVLVGYSMRGEKKLLIAIITAVVLINYIVLPAVALLALHLDVQHERQSRPAQTRVPAIKGLSYQDAETRLSRLEPEHSAVGDTLRFAGSAGTDYRPSSTIGRGSCLRLPCRRDDYKNGLLWPWSVRGSVLTPRSEGQPWVSLPLLATRINTGGPNDKAIGPQHIAMR